MATTVEPRRVSPNSAKTLIKKCLRKKRPVFLWGPPGIGKSDIIWQIGQETGRPVVDIRLLLMDPTDIKGIPFYNPAKGLMEWATPSELPSDKFSNAIIFLDEMNAAPQSVQAAAYQLILNRRVGTYVLPENVVIVAAGNRESDKAVAHKMPSALSNRLIHLEVEHNYDDWVKWAAMNGIHPDVIGYISSRKQDLFLFDPRVSSHAFATPRSWYFASELLIDDNESALNDNELTNLIIGCVGEGTGLQFMAYRRHASQLPKPELILTGKIKKIEAEISIKYSLVMSLCYELQHKYKHFTQEGNLQPWFEMADEFLRFMKRNFEDELIILAIRSALATFELPFEPAHLKEWDAFSDEYESIILAA